MWHQGAGTGISRLVESRGGIVFFTGKPVSLWAGLGIETRTSDSPGSKLLPNYPPLEMLTPEAASASHSQHQDTAVGGTAVIQYRHN